MRIPPIYDTAKPQITVRVTSQYGKSTLVPQCERSEIFAQIANTKTLTVRALKSIVSLGFYINFVGDVPTEEMLQVIR